MKVKRLFTSVSAGFGEFVNKVENHQAVADCVIDELRQATARVRVQQGRIAAQITRLKQRRDELAAEEQRWQQRALSVADDDSAKALECMRRAQLAQSEQETLSNQLAEHTALEQDLRTRVAQLEARLNDFTLKRTALSSREARAQTLGHIQGIGADESADALFERWESAVVADEYRDLDAVAATDLLEQEFLAAEAAADLQARLAALKAQDGES